MYTLTESRPTAAGKHANVKIIATTLCFFVRTDIPFYAGVSCVYLCTKGSGLGAGYKSGYDGNYESVGTPRTCAVRETSAKAGYGIILDNPEDLNYVALGNFVTVHESGIQTIRRTYIFTVEKWRGNFISTTEMYDGKWYPFSNLPLDELLPADKKWLPMVLFNNTDGRRQFFSIQAFCSLDQRELYSSVDILEEKEPLRVS